MNDLTGTSVKGYELRERIGAGGFGAIYKAYQSTVGREVAVKVILPGFANQPDFIRRFETEAQLVARLEHLHVVPLHDYWRDAQGAYLVMRWLRGGSLKDALQKGPYDLEAATLLMDQVCSALAAAHRAGVIHRDLKPGNILLDEDGNAYLADFGIAKEVTDGKSDITQPGNLIGSPDYLAPEQARSEPVTPQTDIYSLGVVLYELLAGEHPFPGLGPVERLYKHLSEPLPIISTFDPDVAAEINGVIQKATAKDPARRFADAMALAAAFREAARLGASRGGVSPVELLTPREQEVLALLVVGKSNREIAKHLVVELATVKWYLNQIYHKLKVRSRVQAIVRASELDLIAHPGAHTTTTSYIFEPTNPYKGLQTFQAADERDFFGREQMTQRLLARLSDGKTPLRFLAVVGPSGSGKSSLVKAGLIPALWRGQLPGSERWFIAEMLPGAHPVDELEIALTRVSTNQKGNIGEQLQRDERGLARAAQMILPNDGSELVLVIDQFEELFTLVEDEGRRKHFLALLEATIQESRSRVRVVVTLRADFYDRPLHYSTFGELLRDHTELVLPLSAEELQQAIVRPAEGQHVVFEEGLVAKIVSEVHYEPGALPLLQYALTELFERREGLTLTHAAYQAIGGTVGALAKRAEELYLELSETGREIARQTFLRMVTLGESAEDTRRRVLRSELMSIAPDPDLLDEIVDSFAAYRLLSLDRDPGNRSSTVELAHEAILREWDRLRGWLDDNRDDIRRERQLAAAAHEWEDSTHETSFLLRGTRLEQFEGWSQATELALTPLEQEYLDASVKHRDKEHAAEVARQARETDLEKRAQTVLRALVAVFAIAALVSGWLAIRASNAETDARRQAAVLLGAQAESEVKDGYYDRAVLLGLEALENYPYTPQAEHALGQAVSYNRALQQYIDHNSAVTSVDWSQDGTKIASSSSDNTVHIWDAATGRTLLVIELPTGITGNIFDWALTVRWSPDGKRLLTVSGDRFLLGSQDYDLILWDAATGEQIKAVEIPNKAKPEQGEGTITSPEHYSVSTAAAFAPDSGRLATVGGDNTAIVWDAALDSQALILNGHENDVNGVAWSPDETRLATASEDGTARIWDVQTGKELLALAGHQGGVNQVAWSPDGSQVATAGKDGTVRFWNAETGDMVRTLRSKGEIVWSLAWSPDGLYLVTGENDAVVRLWEIETGEVVAELNGHQNFVFQVAWSPVDNRLASAGADSTARIWNAAPSTAAQSLPDSNWGALEIEWSHDGRYLSTPAGDWFEHRVPGNLLIWDVTTGQAVVEDLAHLDDQWTWLRGIFSPDDRLLLGLGGPPWPGIKGINTAYVLDAQTGEVIREFTVPGAGEDSFIRVVDWSPDGAKVAAATVSFGEAPGILAVWESQTGDLVTTANCGNSIFALDWSPDGTKIAMVCSLLEGSNYRSWVQIQDAATGGIVMTLSDPDPTALGMSVAWSPDGTRLLTTGGDDAVGPEYNPVIIWDATTGKKLVQIKRHTGQVWWGSWSPDSKRIATGSTDDTTRIWDAENGVELLTLSTPSNWSVVPQWSPAGNLLAVSRYSFDVPSTTEVWRVWQSPEDLIAYANECCVFRELTTDERLRFGLRERTASAGESSSPQSQSHKPAMLPFALSLLSGGLALVGGRRFRSCADHSDPDSKYTAKIRAKTRT